MVTCVSPRIHTLTMLPFCRPQVASGDELEGMKSAVVALKKVCRQRTMVAWKEWRASMEAHRGAGLQVAMASRCYQQGTCNGL